MAAADKSTPKQDEDAPKKGAKLEGLVRSFVQGSLFWAIPFFAIAVLVALSDLSSDRAWPVAALLLIGVVIAVVPGSTWRELLSQLENAKLGPLSIGLRSAAGKAAEQAAERDSAEGTDENPPGEAQNMLELRRRLEWKLAYVAKHLLPKPGEGATFLTIGSLEYDGYLSEEEARTAIGILSTREEELDELPGPARAEFLAEAGRFVDSVRANIFWGQVKRRLQGRDGGDDLLREEVAGGGRRKDLLVGPSGSPPYLVAPAFALDGSSSILDNAVHRLAGEAADAAQARPLVVVPDISGAQPLAAQDGRPQVVKLESLREAACRA